MQKMSPSILRCSSLMARGTTISSISSLYFTLHLLLFIAFPPINAFDAASNEMPVDPNNGIKSAFTNRPVVVRPMPHQPTDYEKMPYEYWHQNRPFVHVHGNEPEHSEQTHQHFPMNYYNENFDNFITDTPGTGLNVRSINEKWITSERQSTTPHPLPTLASALESSNIPQNWPTVVNPVVKMGQPSPRGEKGSAQSLSSRFPHSFQPNLAKLVEETVVVPNSSGAADDEDMLEERSPKKFDTYEDIPTEFKRNLIPTKPVPRPLPSPLAPLASVVGLENHPKTLAITIKPPKLLPFNGQIPLLIFQQWQRGGKRKKVGGGDGGLIVSREQENPKTEGQPSAIVGGDGKPSGAPRIKNNFNNAKKSQPPAYKTAPPPSLLPPAIRYGHLGAQQPYPSADGTGYATTNPFQKHSSAASCICPTSCGGPCSNCANGCPFSACCACDCGQSGGWQFPGGNSCCDDHRSNNCAAQCCGGAGRASSNCRIRLIIACCPRPCARHLLTNRNRVLFTRRRLRRCIGIFEGMVQEAGRNNGGQTKINFEDDKSQERRRRRLWPTSARRNGSQ